MKKQQSILALITLSLLVIIFFVANSIQKQYSIDFKTKLYTKEQNNLDDEFNKYFYNDFYKTYKLTNKLIDDLNIETVLKNGLNNFEYVNSKDRYLTIYTKDGNVLYNSIKDKILYTKSKHYEYFLKHPSCSLDYDISQFGCTISNIIPILDDTILGSVQLQIQFDEVLKNLIKLNIQPIVLLNKKYSRAINISYSYSRKFLNDRYIINKKSNNYYVKLLEQTNIIDKNIDALYDEQSNIIIAKVPLYSNQFDHFADIYLLKSTDDLNYDAIEQFKNIVILVSSLVVFIILLIAYLISSRIRNKYFANENDRLLNENKELKTLSEQLDYNEKKLANLFNLQPNIMFISNGVEIVQVNKRFMGFFRRYGTFKEFKEHHKDIAELFEPYDKPHYISSELVDGKNWLEYILENPKQLYKTVMSVNNEPHHFIIKVNEMEYVRSFQERYIVVAFVDITQDIKHKELLSAQPKFQEDQEFDISYLIEENISNTIYEVTNIIPTKQAIFKANESDVDDTNMLCCNIILTSENDKFNWQMIIPITTISYLQNIIVSNYDGKVIDVFDKDLENIAQSLIDDIFINLTTTINNINNSELSNMNYIRKELSIADKDLIDIKNLYKFDLFVEDQKLEVFINFDENSFHYIKQIQMLGMFFG